MRGSPCSIDYCVSNVTQTGRFPGQNAASESHCSRRGQIDRTHDGSILMHIQSTPGRRHRWAIATCGLTVVFSGIVFWGNRFAVTADNWGAKMPMGELAQHLQLLLATFWMVVIAAASAFMLYRNSSPYWYFVCPVASLTLWMALVLPILLSIR